jgi:hypothetical protein
LLNDTWQKAVDNSSAQALYKKWRKKHQLRVDSLRDRTLLGGLARAKLQIIGFEGTKRAKKPC